MSENQSAEISNQKTSRLFALDALRVFEVDHPDTQEWKRLRLGAADIPIPRSLTFAPVDFERQTLAEGLREYAADFERAFPPVPGGFSPVPHGQPSEDSGKEPRARTTERGERPN